MRTVSPQMQDCIDNCLACYQACFSTAMNHCLQMGGKHVAPDHFRTMMECARICQTSAHFMLMNSPHHPHVCAECAEICLKCAKSCDGLEGMEECAAACRTCADSCKAMAGDRPAKAA